jgi:nitrogen fixation/metabolism regulation signal transduction histidine kinase
MAYNERENGEPLEPAPGTAPMSAPIKRLPLGRSRQRLSFERQLRLWLYLMGLPVAVLVFAELEQHRMDASIEWIAMPALVLGWLFLVSVMMEQITRPLQTLANVVAALREDDYSFRARGGVRSDAMGDLALEVNALAAMLQVQRVGAMEAMALVERVMKSMQSPVLAFDTDGRLKLLNAAAEQAFHLHAENGQGRISTVGRQDLEKLLASEDDAVLSLTQAQRPGRWVVKRSSFRLRGVPHTLFVLSDVSAALREEERGAWERLIRVLGHEINNSLTPIKSIAGSLRSQLAKTDVGAEVEEDFARGLEVIEDRAESLNRFLQAYRELMGLPAPKLRPVALGSIVRRVAQLETRVPVMVETGTELTIAADPDQLAQAMINLVRNAAEAALSVERGLDRTRTMDDQPRVSIGWEIGEEEVIVSIVDNGPGLSNAGNLFVPFYTTKPGGTGIGLVLAQQIALGHAGSVELSNRLETRGCKATLRLPIRAEGEILQ